MQHRWGVRPRRQHRRWLRWPNLAVGGHVWPSTHQIRPRGDQKWPITSHAFEALNVAVAATLPNTADPDATLPPPAFLALNATASAALPMLTAEHYLPSHGHHAARSSLQPGLHGRTWPGPARSGRAATTTTQKKNILCHLAQPGHGWPGRPDKVATGMA